MIKTELRDLFLNHFAQGIKPQNHFKIGIEHEKFLLNAKNQRADYPLLEKLLKSLAENNWQEMRENNHLIGLKKDNKSITTEPGFQFELSGQTHESIHEVCAESSGYLKEINRSAENHNIKHLSIGYDPFNSLKDAPKSPKTRYKIMTEEMPKTGKLSLEMMYQTCGLQVNLDYKSERDFVEKFKISNYIVPILIAIFANSPFKNNALSGYHSYRNFIWQSTARGGMMPIVFEEMSFEKYFDYIINYPLLFIIKEEQYQKAENKTFNDFMNGQLSYLPTIKNFQDHLSTIFTEVRLKQYIEIRSLDTCDWGCICNGPAFLTGLLYNDLEETLSIIKKWKKEEIMQAYISAPKKGLTAELHNKKAKYWAEVLLEISLDGLKKRHKLNKSKQDETIYLSHVRDIINSGKNRAERLIEKYNKTKNLKFLFNEKEDFSYSGF